MDKKDWVTIRLETGYDDEDEKIAMEWIRSFQPANYPYEYLIVNQCKEYCQSGLMFWIHGPRKAIEALLEDYYKASYLNPDLTERTEFSDKEIKEIENMVREHIEEVC